VRQLPRAKACGFQKNQVLLRLLLVKTPHELVLVTTRGSRFRGMFARFNSQLYARVGEGQSERLFVEFVSGTYFPVLGVGSAGGRTILPSDDETAGEQAVVVLSHGYWLSHFGNDATIVGETMLVNNHALSIFGVAEEGFDGTNLT